MRCSSVLLLVMMTSIAYSQDPIRVASFNGEVMGDPVGRDYPRERPSHGYGVARDPKDLADMFQELDADVIALSEIISTFMS